jgi:hypothetical protein
MLTNIQMCYVTMAALAIIVILLSVILYKKTASEGYAAKAGKGGLAGSVQAAASKSAALGKAMEGKAAGKPGADTAGIGRLGAAGAAAEAQNQQSKKDAAVKIEKDAAKQGIKCTCSV